MTETDTDTKTVPDVEVEFDSSDPAAVVIRTFITAKRLAEDYEKTRLQARAQLLTLLGQRIRLVGRHKYVASVKDGPSVNVTVPVSEQPPRFDETRTQECLDRMRDTFGEMADTFFMFKPIFDEAAYVRYALEHPESAAQVADLMMAFVLPASTTELSPRVEINNG